MKGEGNEVEIAVPTNDSFSETIERLLEQFLAASCPDSLGLRQIASRLHALPLMKDMGGCYAVRPNGEIVSFPWDTPDDIRHEADLRIQNMVLCQGSRKYPALVPFAPAKPVDAVECPHCKGTGELPNPFDVAVCYCGGLGWLPPGTFPTVEVVEGDLLDQNVDVIANAWNRNVFPWWLLLSHGVSGAIKRRGGTAPFKELRKHGWIPLGGAVLTSAGTLPFKGIIHVAGINLLWRASERSIRDSVKNAVQLAYKTGFKSLAFPMIGAGSGGFDQDQAKEIMLDELSKVEPPMAVKVVVFKGAKK